MPSSTTASIAIPTRGRPDYLDVTLASVVPQAGPAGIEVLVISDGVDAATQRVAERHGARLIPLGKPAGLNAARNRAVAEARGELIVFIDDDVEVSSGWLEALLDGAHSAPGHDVFGGPISARLEGGGPRACGREGAPITTLDLGPEDRDVALVWGANMAVRRRAFEQVGTFDETISGRGDEEDWERRYIAQGGRIRYVGGAGLEHRRTAADARVRSLASAGYELGRTARRNDVRKGSAPSLMAEIRTLAGCAWHVLRRRCAIGIVLMAHTAGRLREALGEPPPMTSNDFLSGTSGQVSGVRRTSMAVVTDAIANVVALALRRPQRLLRAASRWPRRRVLALGIVSETPNLLPATRQELANSQHDVRFDSKQAANRGKFENLNALLKEYPVSGHDWLLVIDDDVVLPPHFLDVFIFLAERFELRLAQPAHCRRSHAAWDVTRRRMTSIVRETGFVEIGPVTAFHSSTFDVLLPFPELRVGWGLDVHWSALASERGWRVGVIDATPVRHATRQVAAAYDRELAIEEAREFLSNRPYIKAGDAARTFTAHRSWR